MYMFESGKGSRIPIFIRWRSCMIIGLLPLINGLLQVKEKWNADVWEGNLE